MIKDLRAKKIYNLEKDPLHNLKLRSETRSANKRHEVFKSKIFGGKKTPKSLAREIESRSSALSLDFEKLFYKFTDGELRYRVWVSSFYA